jgi:Protein of unknown function (DUF4233)
MRVLASTVLLCEALVVFFASLVAKDLSGLTTAAALLGGGVVAAICLLLCGMLRARWAYVAGSVLQVVLVLSGVIVPAMFFVGGLFAVLWGTALYLGAKGERIAAERRGLSGPSGPSGPSAPS